MKYKKLKITIIGIASIIITGLIAHFLKIEEYIFNKIIDAIIIICVSFVGGQSIVDSATKGKTATIDEK